MMLFLLFCFWVKACGGKRSAALCSFCCARCESCRPCQRVSRALLVLVVAGNSSVEVESVWMGVNKEAGFCCGLLRGIGGFPRLTKARCFRCRGCDANEPKSFYIILTAYTQWACLILKVANCVQARLCKIFWHDVNVSLSRLLHWLACPCWVPGCVCCRASRASNPGKSRASLPLCRVRAVGFRA